MRAVLMRKTPKSGISKPPQRRHASIRWPADFAGEDRFTIWGLHVPSPKLQGYAASETKLPIAELGA